MKLSAAPEHATFTQHVLRLFEQEQTDTVLDTLGELLVDYCHQRWCVIVVKEDGHHRLVCRRGSNVPELEHILSAFDGDSNIPFATYQIQWDESAALVAVPDRQDFTEFLIRVGHNALLGVTAQQQCQRLRQALVERNQLLETMFEVTRDAALSTSRDRLLQIAGLRLMAHVLTTRLFIAVLDAHDRWAFWSRGLALDSATVKAFFEGIDIVHANHALLVSTVKDYFHQYGIATIIPLFVREHLVGIVGIGQQRRIQSYNDSDEFIAAYTNALAVSLEQLRLIERLIEQEQLERELAMARSIQQRLLPNKAVLDKCIGIDIETYLEPARHVSGDYFDIIVRDGRVLCVVADVCGKGVGAALIMAHLHSAFHLLAMMGATPSRILYEWNRLLYAHTEPGSFVTAVAVEYDCQSGMLRYCNAGHPKPLIIADGAVTELPESALVLGVIEEVEYQESSFLLSPNSCICLYSDGVIEAQGEDGTEFGMERLSAALVSSTDLPTAECINRVVDLIRKHCGKSAPSDDITLVIFRRMMP